MKVRYWNYDYDDAYEYPARFAESPPWPGSPSGPVMQHPAQPGEFKDGEGAYFLVWFDKNGAYLPTDTATHDQESNRPKYIDVCKNANDVCRCHDTGKCRHND